MTDHPSILRRRVLAAAAGTALAVSGVVAVGGTVAAPQAQAATCYYSNLTSNYVYNVNCYRGAYACRSGTVWYQSGNAMPAGYYSYNWYAICYIYPGMLAWN